MDANRLIELARDCGMFVTTEMRQVEQWERLAAAVSDEIATAIAAEREACAVAAWMAGMQAHDNSRGLLCDARKVGSAAASAIRMRPDAKVERCKDQRGERDAMD